MNWKIAILLLAAPSFACKEGYVPTDVEGVCMAQPVQKTNPDWIVDEKVPEDKMPSWQREGVFIVNAPDLTAQDIKEDQEKASADKAGRKAAGLK